MSNNHRSLESLVFINPYAQPAPDKDLPIYGVIMETTGPELHPEDSRLAIKILGGVGQPSQQPRAEATAVPLR